MLTRYLSFNSVRCFPNFATAGFPRGQIDVVRPDFLVTNVMIDEVMKRNKPDYGPKLGIPDQHLSHDNWKHVIFNSIMCVCRSPYKQITKPGNYSVVFLTLSQRICCLPEVRMSCSDNVLWVVYVICGICEDVGWNCNYPYWKVSRWTF